VDESALITIVCDVDNLLIMLNLQKFRRARWSWNTGVIH